MTTHYLSLSKLQLESVTFGVLELQKHHSSDNIIGWFNNLLNTWGIEKRQIFLVVTDNVANIKNAVYNFFNDTNDIANIINKIKLLVTFFKQSVSATDELNKTFKLKLKLLLTELKLVTDSQQIDR
ncbi:Ribonuclease H-like domain [Cinara cedri]|uniref:Ribonuclease H-like domain n=1 Tax=Cinara cedri TaxID=506608 RepID=A0A5E4NE17_9HEMI|nr:Ribonuclease H-like domain [Cinara cedri]